MKILVVVLTCLRVCSGYGATFVRLDSSDQNPVCVCEDSEKFYVLAYDDSDSGCDLYSYPNDNRGGAW